MYAIVDIAGQQYKVEKEQKLFVHRLDDEVGKKVEFDKVILIDEEGKVKIGTPTLEVTVTAQILQHLKGDKVIVFKKKRRKGYKVKNGHRQFLTHIQIEEIAETTAKKKVEKKKEKVVKEKITPKAEEVEVVKKEVTPTTIDTKLVAEKKVPATKKQETTKKEVKTTVVKKSTTVKSTAVKKTTATKKETDGMEKTNS